MFDLNIISYLRWPFHHSTGNMRWEVFEEGFYLFPLSNIDHIHGTGAYLTGLILEKQNARHELWVLVISIKDGDGDVDAGIVVLSSVHFL